jgi:hypothetical protein
MAGITDIWDLSDFIHFTMTGGNEDAEPTLQDVQYMVGIKSQLVTRTDWQDNYKAFGQRDTNQKLIVPFMDLELSDYKKYGKRVLFPAVALNLPMDRGLAFATVGDPEVRLLIERKSDRINFGIGATYNSFAYKNVGHWIGDYLEVYSSCRTERTSLKKVNLYTVIANEDTLTGDLNSLIASEVIKELRANPVRPNQADSQTNAIIQ